MIMLLSSSTTLRRGGGGRSCAILSGMTEDRFPAIDDPGMHGGLAPEPRATPFGDTAGNTGSGDDIAIQDLDLPGPDDPVAWRYVKEGTPVHGSDGEQLGTVATMLGSDQEDIFHGIAVSPGFLGTTRVVRADDVVAMTPARVDVSLDAAAFAETEEHRPAER